MLFSRLLNFFLQIHTFYRFSLPNNTPIDILMEIPTNCLKLQQCLQQLHIACLEHLEIFFRYGHLQYALIDMIEQHNTAKIVLVDYCYSINECKFLQCLQELSECFETSDVGLVILAVYHGQDER